MKTLSIGLTGGIGSSKTLIAEVFTQMGVPVFNADMEAKQLYNKPNIQKDMEAMFSQKLFDNNKLDKNKLAQIIFNNKKQLQKLNLYIHPLVENEYKNFLNFHTIKHCPYVIMESAIIFESGWQENFDKIICVNTPQELMIKRTMLRDNTDKEIVLRKIANQIPIKDKVYMSDYVINNDDLTLVLPQIIEIDKQIKNNLKG